jgi:signal transduction histidine kinase
MAERSALDNARGKTDAARKKFDRLGQSGAVRRAAGDALEDRITELSNSLNSLERIRAAIDGRRLDRWTAVSLFTEPIDAGFRVYSSISTLDDEGVAKYARTMVEMSRSRELLSQEDAMITGLLTAKQKFSDAEQLQFVALVGAQRFQYEKALAELPEADQKRYNKFTSAPAFIRFRTIEDQVVKGGSDGFVTVTAAVWRSASDPVISGRRDLETASSNDLIKRATPVVVWVIVRLLLAGGLGLLAVVASIVMSITTARSLVRQLEKLRGAALGLAIEKLPRVVERLRAGEEVDVAAEAPPLAFGTDEIGQVGRAFNLVQETAVQVAVEQAALRKGVRDVFLSLARRSQALVHRQLTLLDTMERRENSPEELENLFRVDHLATRMRRNAENLIVLSGAVPGRGWRNPVPLVDVVRGAVAEVEEYERVTVSQIGTASLAGRSVGDIIHLLAELVENALSFSPPHTMVHVSGELVGNGFAVEIEDRGLGMSEADLDAANEQLANPPEFNLSSTARLGLYVVGRLSERHQLRVRLRSSPYGGVTAVVLIPSALVVNAQPSGTLPTAERDRLASARAAILAGQPVEGAGGRTPEVTDTPSLGATRRERTIPRVRDASAARALTAIPVERTTPSPAAAPKAPAEPAEAQAESAEAQAGASLTDQPVSEPTVPAEVNGAPARPEETELAEPGASETQAIPLPPMETLTGAPLPYGSTRTATVEVRTPSGLPRRVRQASLAAPLRDDAPAAEELEPAMATPRPPEEVRQMMASYQKGTVLGRTDAEQVPDARQPAEAVQPSGAALSSDEATDETGQTSGDR